MAKAPLVLGIGNSLLSDEGIGVHVADYLARQGLPDAGVRCLDGGTLGFTLAGEIDNTEHLIVVDAARMKAAPGTIGVFIDDAFDQYVGGGRLSAHEVGLADLMDVALLSGGLPTHRALVGIEPQNLGWGEQPSEALQSVVPQAAQQVISLLTQWGCLPAERVEAGHG